MVAWMMARDSAMETFFWASGAWAKAGVAASMEAEARMARLTKRILELPGCLLLGALMNPRRRRLIHTDDRIFAPAAMAAAGYVQLLRVSGEAFLQPVKLRAEVALDIRRPDEDPLIVPLLKPSLPRRAVGNNHLRLIRVDQLDRKTVHKGNEVRDLAADGGLALELAGETTVLGQCLPQDALGVGRISSQQPGQSLQRAARVRHYAPLLSLLGQQRAQPRRLLAVEHAALGRSLASLGDRHHHAVQGVHVLLGRVHAGEDVAQ